MVTQNWHTNDKFSCMSPGVKTNVTCKVKIFLPCIEVRILTKTSKPIQMFQLGAKYSWYVFKNTLRYLMKKAKQKTKKQKADNKLYIKKLYL